MRRRQPACSSGARSERCCCVCSSQSKGFAPETETLADDHRAGTMRRPPPAASEVGRSVEAMSTMGGAGTRQELAGGFVYYSLARLADQGLSSVSRLPITVKILLENLLRHSGERFVSEGDVEALARWDGRPVEHDKERAFMPARVLLQDFT